MFRAHRDRGRRRPAGPSIYEHLRRHLPADGSEPSEIAQTLPDENLPDETPSGEQAPGGGVRWAPGARDGVLTHHWAGTAEPAAVDRLYTAVVAAVRKERAYDELYELVRDEHVIAMVDDLLPRLRDSGFSEGSQERLYRLGHRLTVTAGHREAVKLGMSILAMYSAESHRDELMTLGRHDEFTLFAAPALANRADGDGEDDLWELARQITGWGRVHLVERLADSPKPEIREWILRDGFRNSVTDQYLAGIAAESGDLVRRLAGDPNDDLLYSAGDILTALCEEYGPVQGMPAYDDGRRAADLFLGHMLTRATDLRHFLAVHAVREYAAGEWPELASGPCAEILSRPLWPGLARAGLGSADPVEFRLADRACRILGIPTLRLHMDRLRSEPYDLDGWFGVTGQVDAGSVAEVVEFAVELLPLEEIATGPGDESAFGPGYAAHRCLDVLLGALRDQPGHGWPLAAAGLASPVRSNRHQSIRTLAAWDRADWPAEAPGALRAALAREPVTDVREALQKLLNGEAPDG